jgi:hypothetical protein
LLNSAATRQNVQRHDERIEIENDVTAKHRCYRPFPPAQEIGFVWAEASQM